MMKKLMIGFLVNLMAIVNVQAFSGGNGSAENPYQIANRADLEAINGDLGAHYKMMCDIDLSGVVYNKAVIAPDSLTYNYSFDAVPFSGSFDGNGFTIKNMRISSGSADFLGVFGKVTGRVISLGVEGCSVSGEWYLGGLCGDNAGYISDCYSSGSIQGQEYSRYVGGFCGASSGTILKSYSSCSVSMGVMGFYIGGFCGLTWHANISDCYAHGSVTVPDARDGNHPGASPSQHAGGFCGRVEYSSIINCYSDGLVSEYASYDGGFCGSMASSTITSCFWDRQTSGFGISAAGTGLTTIEMGSISNFTNAGWDFCGETINGTDEIWDMPGSGAPVLRWQRNGVLSSQIVAVEFLEGEHGTFSNSNSTQDVFYGDSALSLAVVPDPDWYFVGWDKPLGPITNDLVIVALYAERVDVEFDPGLGVVSTVFQSVTNGFAYGSLPVPTRTGYTFDGWWDDENGAGSEVAASTVVDTVSDHTLFARWTADSYVVTFDAEGGEVDPASQFVTYDSLYGTLPVPTRTGYTFDGWWDNENGTGSVVTASTTVSTANDQTLYAQWTVNQYTLSFGSAGGTAVAPITQDYDTPITTPPAPTRIGYTFAGWNPTVPATMPADNLTLTAQWVANQYTLSFDAEGGAVDPASKTVIFNSPYGSLSVPVRMGHTFDGWWVGDNGTGSLVLSNTVVSTASDHTLHAKWVVNQYVLSFDGAGGTTVAPITQDYDTPIAPPTTPTRTGYTFANWSPEVPATMPATNQTLTAQWTVNQYTLSFDSADGTAVAPITQDYDTPITTPTTPMRIGYSFAGWKPVVPATMPAENQTLTAQWVANPYDVTFDAEGGVVDPGGKTVTFDSPYGTLPTPSLTGYAFGGWWDGDDGTGSQMNPTTLVTKANSHTLHAKWIANPYEVVFDAEGGTVDPGSKTVTFDSPYGTLPVPARTGYTFEGWWNGDAVTASTMVTMATNHSLFALWTTNSYTVTFDPGSGVVGTNSIEVVYESPYGALPIPVRAGHTFDGWWTEAGSNVVESTVVSVAEDHSLFARWNINQHFLLVDSEYGDPMPLVGTNWYDWGSSVTCSVDGTDTQEAVRYLCSGWSGSGSVPVTGSGTNTSFTITNDSSIVWSWDTEYWLDTETNGCGSINVSDGWYTNGASVAIMAVPTAGFEFAGWIGDIAGCTVDGASITAPMDQPRTITAQFIAAPMPDLSLDSAGLRILAANGAEVWDVDIGDELTFDMLVQNTGDAPTAGSFELRLFEGGTPDSLELYDTNDFIVLTSVLCEESIPAGGSLRVPLAWTVSGLDRVAALTVLAEFSPNRLQSQANADSGALNALPALEVSLENNSVRRMLQIGSAGADDQMMQVLIDPLTGLEEGRSYELSGRAVYGSSGLMSVLGASVNVIVNGVSYPTRTLSPDGLWNVSLNGLPAGSHEVNASVFDGFSMGSATSVLEVAEGPDVVDLRLVEIECEGSGVFRTKYGVSDVYANGAVDLSAYVRNDGNVGSGPFDVVFRAPGGEIICSERIAGLDAYSGIWISASSSWAAPASGVAQLTVAADAMNEVSEIAEDNNTAATTIRVGQPQINLQPYKRAGFQDWMSGLFFSPSQPLIGERIQISCDVFNRGAEAVPAGTTLAVDFSVDGVVVGRGSQLLSIDLAMDDFATVMYEWDSSGFSKGWASISAEADPDNQIAEEVEADNQTERILYLFPVTENLHVSEFDLSVRKPAVSTVIQLQATALNDGGEDSVEGDSVHFYEGSIAPENEIGSVSLPALAARGGSTMVSIPWTTPATPGTVTLVATTGRGFHRYSFDVVETPIPDLAVFSEDIFIAPEFPQEGASVAVSAQIHNLSGATATNASVHFFVDSGSGIWIELGAPKVIETLATEAGVAVHASIPIEVTQPAYALMVQVMADENQGEAFSGDNAATRSFTRADIPVANAGADQTVLLGDLVQLSGVLSSNANAFSWRILSAPVESSVALSGADTVYPSFVPDAGGIYEIELVVSGAGYTSEPDTIRVVVDLPWYEVVFDVGEHGTRSGGGALTQSVEWGCGAVAPDILPEPGWIFVEWSTAFDPVYSALSVTALYQQVSQTLHVESVHGIPSPANGDLAAYWGTNLTCSVGSPDTQGATQYVCSGWTGTGSVPENGAGTSISFTITNDSSIVWNWSTNYWLEAEITGAGSISGGDEWLAKASSNSLSAIADDGWRFDHWVLDGQPVGGTTNVLDVLMDAAHTAAAHFVVLDLPEAVDNHELVWSTGGHTNWFATTEMSHDGIDVARSGIISTWENTWLATTVTNAGTLSFWWRVSSEEGCDEFSWYLDGELQDMISGEAGTWEQVVCRIDGNGMHALKWEYTKDKSFAYGEDCAWLDEVVWLADKWLDTEVSGAGSVDVEDGWYHHGSNAVVHAIPDAHHHFIAWAGNLSGCTTNSAEIIVPMMQDRQIVARFEPDQYQVMFDAQGGRSPVPSGIQVRYQDVYGPLASVEREGYGFDGWWTASSGGEQVTTGTVVTATEAHTLYAHWAANSYTVSLDGQGGVLSTNTMEVTFDSPYGAFPPTLRTGYGFDGWWTAPNGAGIAMDESTVMTTASNHTLYASWTAEELQVTYDAAGGAVSPDSDMVICGAQYGLLPFPVRAGYAFDGWWTGPEGAGSQILSLSTVVATSNHVLYAKWNVNSYEVTFDAQGGSVTSASTTVVFDAPYGTLPVPVRDGHTFKGWWTDEYGNGSLVDFSTIVSTATNHSLYAEWQLDARTLAVSSDHGTSIPAVGAHTNGWGTNLTCFVISPDVQGTTRYVCSGWSGTGSVPPEGGTTNASFTITNNSTIVWNWNTEYLLDTDVVGNGSVDLPDSWVAAGSNVSVQATAAVGNRFDHWVLDGMQTGGNTNSIEVPMGSAHQLTAHFVVLDLPEALDNHSLIWTNGGDAVWNPQITESHDEVDAAQSGQVTDNQSSWIETTVSGAGAVSFWWSVSCEDAYGVKLYDRLRLFVNGTEELYICGEVDWQFVNVEVPSNGTHILRWEYYKDKSDTFGADCGWVDQVVWTPADPFAAWAGQYGLSSDKSADADGDGQSNLQEYVFGTNPTNKLDANVLELKNGSLNLRAREKRWYIIEGTEDLLNPNWIVLGRFFGSDTNLTMIDPDAALFDSQYYRIKADVMPNDPATFDTDGDGTMDVDDSAPFSKDSDGDGMPDDWESRYSTGGAGSDSDSDGYSDYAEYVFGTLPNDDTSRLFWSVGESGVRVGTASNRIYWIDYKPSLTVPWQVWKRFGGDGSTNIFNQMPSGDAGYFRVRATSGNILQMQE